jgi:hypothetical protein
VLGIVARPAYEAIAAKIARREQPYPRQSDTGLAGKASNNGVENVTSATFCSYPGGERK